ncbi:MAG: Imm42 family immunity protein [Desulfobulbus sp.]|nr:Imm42 family immunity protein [Desulfobulbus sp.]
MIFGDKNDFAIESMVEPELVPPSSPWGRMRVWISGAFIGDYDDPHCGLHDAFEGFAEKAEQLNELWMADFENLLDTEIWNFLDGRLYGYHGNEELKDNRSLDEILLDAEKYSKFNFLTNWGEMFDRGGKSFIIKNHEGQLKVLNFDHQNNKVRHYLCSEFTFCKAIKDFSKWYKEQFKLLTGKDA